tara:strand:+ start:122 stop:400 length:279 start_codon:yes stop_codon:yes gene_type:complete
MAEEKPKEEETPLEEEKKLSIVEEAKIIRDEILKAKGELKDEREKLEKAQAQDLLGGKTEGAIPKVEAKEETPQDYAARVLDGTAGTPKVEE